MVTEQIAPLVSGKIVFDSSVPALANITLRVFLEDVSLMDMPARVIAEHIDHNAVYNSDGIHFKLFGELPSDKHRYVVRVHISRDGSPDFKSGDFISVESYPVLTYGAGQQVVVKVKQI